MLSSLHACLRRGSWDDRGRRGPWDRRDIPVDLQPPASGLATSPMLYLTVAPQALVGGPDQPPQCTPTCPGLATKATLGWFSWRLMVTDISCLSTRLLVLFPLNLTLSVFRTAQLCQARASRAQGNDAPWTLLSPARVCCAYFHCCSHDSCLVPWSPPWPALRVPGESLLCVM